MCTQVGSNDQLIEKRQMKTSQSTQVRSNDQLIPVDIMKKQSKVFRLARPAELGGPKIARYLGASVFIHFLWVSINSGLIFSPYTQLVQVQQQAIATHIFLKLLKAGKENQRQFQKSRNRHASGYLRKQGDGLLEALKFKSQMN